MWKNIPPARKNNYCTNLRWYLISTSGLVLLRFPFRFFKILKIFMYFVVNFIDAQYVIFEHLAKQSNHTVKTR